MKLSYGASDFSNLSQHVSQLAGQLPALEVELRARWREAAPDGYPSSSMGGHGRPSHELDPATGEPIPLPNYSDRTGETATAEPTKDQDALALTKAYNQLCAADAALRSAKGLLDKALKPPAEVENAKPEDPGCPSCRRLRRPGNPQERVWEPITQGGLCNHCWNVNTATGQWPPVDVLEELRNGTKSFNPSRIASKVESRDEQIHRLRQAGLSLRRIAEQVGLSHQMVKFILEKPPTDGVTVPTAG